MVRLGLLPALNNQYGEQHVSLVHNDNARYTVRWVDLDFFGESPWVRNIIERLSLPIAHGEGKLYAPPPTLQEIQRKNLIAARYVHGQICELQHLPPNPNGSLDDIAGLTDESGRVLGLMPHPERAREFTHLPQWTLLREHYRRNNIPLPTEGPGLQIFKNGAEYFS